MSQRLNPNLIGFVLLSYAIVGLSGVFASYAAPLPLERAMARDTTLDAVLAAQGQPDEAARLAALRVRLGDSADAVLGAPAPTATASLPGTLAERVAHERTAMRGRLQREADAVANRLHWLLGMITLMGAAFGVAMLGAARGPAD